MQTTTYSTTVNNGRLVINISKSPGVNWKLGFQQLEIPLKKGRYRLTFDAFATQQNQLLITLSKNYPDWSTYVYKNVTVKSKESKYEVIFNMPTNEENSRLFFGIGKFTGNFSIDNISFSRIEESTVNSELVQLNGSNLFIYPNPNKGTFTLDIADSETAKNSKLKIYNLAGTPVFEQNKLKQKTRINLKQPTGIYFVHLISKEAIVVKKIIIR